VVSILCVTMTFGDPDLRCQKPSTCIIIYLWHWPWQR